jgi:hypothetical protein
MKGLSNILPRLDYTGDVGRLYSGSTLLDDNFFNGLPWEIGVGRFDQPSISTLFTLKVLPMPKVAPIYLDPIARRLLDEQPAMPQLLHATLIPEYESSLLLR